MLFFIVWILPANGWVWCTTWHQCGVIVHFPRGNWCCAHPFPEASGSFSCNQSPTAVCYLCCLRCFCVCARFKFNVPLRWMLWPQALLLNHRGSPWAVKWYLVHELPLSARAPSPAFDTASAVVPVTRTSNDSSSAVVPANGERSDGLALERSIMMATSLLSVATSAMMLAKMFSDRRWATTTQVGLQVDRQVEWIHPCWQSINLFERDNLLIHAVPPSTNMS